MTIIHEEKIILTTGTILTIDDGQVIYINHKGIVTDIDNADITKLPAYTKFYVKNGDWVGYIDEKLNQKFLMCGKDVICKLSDRAKPYINDIKLKTLIKFDENSGQFILM